MPRFMDYHDNLKLTGEATAQITADSRDRRGLRRRAPGGRHHLTRGGQKRTA